MKTLSEFVSQLKPVELPCDDCDGTGQQEAVRTNVRSFFSPYGYVQQACPKCDGQGMQQSDVCPLCEQVEGICDRACHRTTCCQQHPAECECPGGLELYLQVYGLPKAA